MMQSSENKISLIGKKHSLSALFSLVAVVFTFCVLTPIVCDSSPMTFDDIATKHQDAVLALKRFSFKSVVKGDGDAGYIIVSNGTVDLDGWSHYTTAVSSESGGKSVVTYEYFVKDDYAYRMTEISDDRYPAAADVLPGWESVEQDVFHTDVPLNPLYYYARYIGNENELDAVENSDGSSDCKSLTSSVSGASITFCVGESGLVARMSATMNMKDSDVKLDSSITEISDAVEISVPEKVISMFDDMKKKEEKKTKK